MKDSMLRSEKVSQLQQFLYYHKLCYSYITISIFFKNTSCVATNNGSYIPPGDLSKGWHFAYSIQVCESRLLHRILMRPPRGVIDMQKCPIDFMKIMVLVKMHFGRILALT